MKFYFNIYVCCAFFVGSTMLLKSVNFQKHFNWQVDHRIHSRYMFVYYVHEQAKEWIYELKRNFCSAYMICSHFFHLACFLFLFHILEHLKLEQKPHTYSQYCIVHSIKKLLELFQFDECKVFLLESFWCFWASYLLFCLAFE